MVTRVAMLVLVLTGVAAPSNGEITVLDSKLDIAPTESKHKAGKGALIGAPVGFTAGGFLGYWAFVAGNSQHEVPANARETWALTAGAALVFAVGGAVVGGLIGWAIRSDSWERGRPDRLRFGVVPFDGTATLTVSTRF